MRKHASSTLIALTLLLLVGCSSEPGDTSPTNVNTSADAAEIVSQCLQDKGWNAEAGDDGGVGVAVPKEQAEKYELDEAECWATVETPTFDDLSSADRSDFYDRLVALRGCLLDFGLTLPPPPSFQAWVDMEGAWSPYIDIDPTVMQDSYEEIEAACPQLVG